MKVLMVNKFHYRFGGAETYYFGLSDLLRSAGHTVIPFSSQDPSNELSEYSRFFVDQVDLDANGSLFWKAKTGLSLIYSAQARRKIGDLLDLVAPDVVHIHNYNFQITPSILYAIKSRGVPVVHTMHDPQLVCPHHRLYDYNVSSVCEKCKGLRFHHAVTTHCIKNSYAKSAIGALESYLYHSTGTYRRSIDLCISPSEFLKEKTLAMGFRPKRIEVIPNFVDFDSIGVGPGWGDYGVYVGRLSHEKGIQTLLEAMRRVSNGKLLVVGDGPMKRDLESAVERWENRTVEFLGRKTAREVIELLQGSAFSVAPSEWYENLPLSVIESFACGKAVVASRSGGLVEMVEHEKTGLLFQPGDVRGLAGELGRLFGSKDLQRRYGEEARRTAEKRYGKQLHLERIIAAYLSVMTRGRQARPGGTSTSMIPQGYGLE